jgi:cobalt-zinc-cadmium efflux system membrane fusion protein
MKTLINIVMLAVLFSCGTEQQEPTQEVEVISNEVVLNADQIRNAKIKEGFAEKRKIGVTIYANGTIEVPPQNKTVITAQFGGFVKSLEVLDGMEVQKGTKLLSLEDPALIQLQQDYLEVLGSFEYLKAEYERQKNLFDNEASSGKLYQQAKAAYLSSKAQKNGLEMKLKMAGIDMKKLEDGDLQRTVAIVAPFNGVVTKVNVQVGAYADPKDHLLEIIDLKHSHAEVIVFEKDLKYLKKGQEVKLDLSDSHGQIGASVFLIGKEISKDRTVKVHCHLDQENDRIAPGSYFKASILAGENTEYCVPSEAVLELNGKNVVFIHAKKDNDKTMFRAVPVRILVSDHSYTAFEFENPELNWQQKIVVSGAYDLLSQILISGED